MSKLNPSENGLANPLLRKGTSTSFKTSFPKPKKASCFQCQKEFYIKFVVPRKDYSQKNSWTYWTGNKGNKQICNSCLKTLYYDKLNYWQTITDLRKRNILRNYIYDGSL